ncbi:MAG: DegV family protein [Anaerolineae bacterium]|jgi:DegV family protein with EDD domain
MAGLRIATDSTADVPPGLASDLQIAVVPCQVFWGEEVYRDGVDLQPQEFYQMLARSADLPKTSQPPMNRFVETYRRLLNVEGAEAVISIHVAGNLSGTVNGAWAAAQTLSDPSQIEVIDSGQISLGLGWAVIEAAQMAQSGFSREDVSRAVHGMLPRLRAAAMIDTLENLYKGGRISQVTAALGTVLRVKPLIRIERGRVEVIERVRTRSRALKRLVVMVRSWGPLARVAVLHTGAEELAQELVSMIEDLAPDNEIMIEPAGAALTTHLGIGAVGVCAVAAPGEEWLVFG